jgi:hypothetical protein
MRFFCAFGFLVTGMVTFAAPVRCVIHVSFDGLRGDAIAALTAADLPTFYRFRREGVFTDNARCDFLSSVTLPNHTSQLTGRPVYPPNGHAWVENGAPPPGATLASTNGAYVASVFDVAHDAGLRTGLYASKSKFSLFESSWNATNGAPDRVGPDNGQGKIDRYVYEPVTSLLIDRLLADMVDAPFNYVLLHLRDLDTVGHTYGWDVSPGSPYLAMLRLVDAQFGRVVQFVDTNSFCAGRTVILFTADHGGNLFDHSDYTLPDNYTIPFYVWGPEVSPAELYRLNPHSRANPGTGRPTQSDVPQPIRNGDAANLALAMLGLPPVPGSTINAKHDLLVALPAPPDFTLSQVQEFRRLRFTTQDHLVYTLQRSLSFSPFVWQPILDLPGDGLPADIWVQSCYPLSFYRLSIQLKPAGN